MKITLSKSQWEKIGKQAGWMKKAQESMGDEEPMADKMDNFFSPSITLKRHSLGGKTIHGFWYADLVKDFSIVRQIAEEAGIKTIGNKIPDANLDAFELAAGNHGFSVETIGE